MPFSSLCSGWRHAVNIISKTYTVFKGKCIKKENTEQQSKNAGANCSFKLSCQNKPLRWTFEQKIEGVEGNQECGYLGERNFQTKAIPLKNLLKWKHATCGLRNSKKMKSDR